MRTILSTALYLLLSCLFLTGCSDGKIATEKVTGIITLDGQPLEGATVNFSPKTAGQGSPSYGVTDAKGEYKLQTLLGNPDAGTTPGEYVVTVIKLEKSNTPPPALDGPSGPPPKVTKPKSLIPELYGAGKTTPFSATVKSGANECNFELQSKP